jgi:hypothetical protein
MSLSLIIGWKNFYERGTILETNVNKAFLQLDTDHIGKVNDLDNEVKDTKEEVKETQEDVDDIKGDITNINNVLVNIQNAQVEINNTMKSNRHNPRFTGTMVMDGDMQIGGTLLQGWPVDTITTPFYSNNNEYTINGVNDVFTDSNISVPTYSRSFELSFKNNNNNNVNNTYNENSFYSNTNEYYVINSNSSFKSDIISIPSNTTLKTIEISFKNSSNGAHPNGGYYGLLAYGYQFSPQPYPACNNQNLNYFFIDNVNNKIGMFNGTSGATGFITWNYNTSHGNLFDNVYHHFIALINVSTNSVTIYIDGINIGTKQFSNSLQIDHDTDGIALGSNGINADNPEYFLGYVKDFYIYDKVLSTQEIATRYSIFQGNSSLSNNTNYGLLTSGFSSIGTNNANFNYFYFDMTNDNIVMYNGTSGSNGIATISYDISSLFDNNYHHFIATISTVSRVLTIYIDGQSVGTYTFASDDMIDCDSNGVRIGASIVDINNDIFKGSIKNIHIHNKYLSQEEVIIRYNLFNE